jgi:hypothetical protein
MVNECPCSRATLILSYSSLQPCNYQQNAKSNKRCGTSHYAQHTFHLLCTARRINSHRVNTCSIRMQVVLRGYDVRCHCLSCGYISAQGVMHQALWASRLDVPRCSSCRHFDASYWAMLKVQHPTDSTRDWQQCECSSAQLCDRIFFGTEPLLHGLQLANPTWGVIGLNYREVCICLPLGSDAREHDASAS